MWVFGYGSLVWRPNFPYKQKIVGYVKGYVRRFWHGSTRFRGVPGKPGRVVTLVEEPKGCVWGVAYEVAAEDREHVKEYLDARETGGYKAEMVDFWQKSDNAGNHYEPFKVMVYFSTSAGENYLGPASTEIIARQIAGSVGPVGTNAEYLFNLAEAMRTSAPEAEDLHLFELEKLVKELMKKNVVL